MDNVLKIVTPYQEEIKNIQHNLKQIDSVDERIAYLNDKFNRSHNDVKEILSYYSLLHTQAALKKSHKRLEERPFTIGIGYLADSLIDKWKEYEGRNEELVNYTCFKYLGEKAPGKVSLTTKEDSFNVRHELQMSQIEYLQSNEKLHLSKTQQREERFELIKQNLSNYPELIEKYEVYEELGLHYGFSMDAYIQDERKLIKNKWINTFNEEMRLGLHNKSGEERYHKLRKMYNQLGYDLTLVLDSLRKPSEIVKTTPNGIVSIDNKEYVAQSIESHFDLGNPKHISSLLEIQKGLYVGDFVGVYTELDKSDINSSISKLCDEFLFTLKTTYLTDIETDIVKLIINEHEDLSVFRDHINPYKNIAAYINEKYHKQHEVRDIKHIVKKVSQKVSNTYRNLENGMDTKQCVSCKSEKLHSNFGKDTRNKDGLKSICKQCLSRKENNIQVVS